MTNEAMSVYSHKVTTHMAASLKVYETASHTIAFFLVVNIP